MSKDDLIKRKLEDNSKMIDAFIDNLLKPSHPKTLYEASRHLIMAGGKRLRPYLTVKACESVGGTQKDAVPFAAGLEILHNFTLIHDDVMDNDSVRRGAPTVHTLWGIPIAIAAGDLLFAKVYEAFYKFAPEGMSCKRVLACIEAATSAAIMISEGQALDISFPKTEGITEADYITMVGRKTGALFRACAEVGALTGGGKKNQVKALGQYAWDAGIVFQLIDDYLGAIGDEKTIGKPVGSDLREGKKTLIIIHALKHARRNEKEKILGTLGQRLASINEIKEINDILTQIGSIEYCLKTAEKYSNRAKKRLNKISDSAARRDLLELVDYFTQRNY